MIEAQERLKDIYYPQFKATNKNRSNINTAPVNKGRDAVLKQIMPQYIYSPPFGYPKRLNGIFLRRIAKNLHVSSILKSIKESIIITPWDIVVEEGEELTEQEEQERKEVKRLFENPNPEDTYDSFSKKLIEDLFVLDAGCINNVLDRKGRLTELRAIDGASILKNPDIHGSFQYRDNVITTWNNFVYTNYQNVVNNKNAWKDVQSIYSQSFTSVAAYFQYNSAGANAYPTPYGKDEIVYMQLNPESEGVYTNGSHVSDSIDVILALVYGVKYHLDFYINGNTPEGIVNLAGGTSDDVASMKGQIQNSLYTVDEITGQERKMGYVMPITTSDNASFIPLTFNSKDMEILGQQALLSKLLWQRFGLTADEMGQTDNSNRATSTQQTENSKRKAIMPVLKVIEDNYNKFIIKKFFKAGCKLKFKFIHDTSETELVKLNIYKQKVDLGIETWQTIAEKENIDIKKLMEFKEQNKEPVEDDNKMFEGKKEDNNKEEMKSKTITLDKLEEELLKNLTSIPSEIND